MKKFLALLVLLFPIGALSQTAAFNGFCANGGKTVNTQGLQSSTTVQQSFPKCTVAVFLTGTSTLATIYSDGNNTPLTNPFTAQPDASWHFYAASATQYDVTMSGGIPPNTFAAPITLVALQVGGGSANAAGTLGQTQIKGSTGAFSASAPASCLAFGSIASCVSGTTSALIPPGMTGSFTSQGNSLQATAGCSIDSTTGFLNVFPQQYGLGYSGTTTTVTVTGGSGTASVTGNVVSGQVTSYTVNSSSGFVQSVANPSCTAVVTVAAPPTTPTAIPLLALNSTATPYSNMTAYTADVRVDDFGAMGDGVTDDTAAFQKAVNYAAQNNFKIATVSLTQGKTYFLGSIGGFYNGAFDNGIAPVAGTVTISDATTCTVVSRGSGLTTTTITRPSGTAGTIGGLTLSGGQIPATCTVSGATGTPYTAYVGPTCTGIPCTVLTPEVPAKIGYSVGLPDNVTIEGHGATISGGFGSGQIGNATYTDSTFPYIATLASLRPGGSGHIQIRDVSFSNVFIAVGNIGSYLHMDNISWTGGALLQANNAQFVSLSNINTRAQTAQIGGVYIGGQWSYRAPVTGQGASTLVNGFDLGDDLLVNNYQFFGYTTFGTTAQYLAVRKAWDCWWDRTEFHLEDQGITNSLGCYTPPGGTIRMPDQDLSGQVVPDDMWRGFFTLPLAIYTRYGRATNSVLLDDILCKGNGNFCVLSGPSNNNAVFTNIVSEGSGLCNNNTSVSYGDSTCPNPYQPDAIEVPSVVLANGDVTYSTIIPSGRVQRAVSQPYQLGSQGVSYNTPFASSRIAISDSSPDINGTNPYTPLGYYVNLLAFPANNFQGATRLNSDSIGAYISGSRYFANAFREDDWFLIDRLSTYAPGSRSVLELSNVINSINPAVGLASVKVPGLEVNPLAQAGGNVTSITITNAGTLYPAYSSVPCSISQSTSTSVFVPGSTTVPYTATCFAYSGAAGTITSVMVDKPGVGYIAAPTVTIGTPASGGTQATATSAINIPDTYYPIGHFVMGSTFFTAGTTFPVPSNTITTITGVACPGAIFTTNNVSKTDKAQLLNFGNTTGNLGLIVDSWVTAANTCTVTLANATTATITAPAGTSASPWTFLMTSADTTYSGLVANAAVTPTSASFLPSSAAGVASINGAGGAFSFTGSGVTCVTTTCTFTTGGGGGSGTVTSFSAGALSPIFTTTVTSATTTPTLSFTLANAAQNAFLAGPASGGAGAPAYRAITAADIPTLNQNTTGTASNVTGVVAIANGGTGTASPGLVAGTNVTITGTWPNQTINSTGSGGGISALTGDVTASGSGSVAATVVRINGTSLSGLGTGLLKNTTGTGVPSIAAASDINSTFGSQTANTFYAAPNGSAGTPTFRAIVTADVPTLNQNTTGNAATASALAGTPTLCSTGSAPTGILANGNATGCAIIGGGSGTVTSVSVVTANGVSGTVANATTTPAITLVLGAITPSSVAATGALSGASVSTGTGSTACGSATGCFAAVGASTVATGTTNQGSQRYDLSANKWILNNNAAGEFTSAMNLPINGAGVGAVSGPSSATATDVPVFTSTTGGVVDSGIAIASLATLGTAQTFTALKTFGAFASIGATVHGVLLSENTGAVVATSAGTSGQCFMSNGASTDPSFQTCSGGGSFPDFTDVSGTGAFNNATASGTTTFGIGNANTTATSNTVVTIGSAGAGQTTQLTLVGDSGQNLGAPILRINSNALTNVFEVSATQVYTQAAARFNLFQNTNQAMVAIDGTQLTSGGTATSTWAMLEIGPFGTTRPTDMNTGGTGLNFNLVSGYAGDFIRCGVAGANSVCRINAAGDFTGRTFTSTVATGTAPFVVASTTSVANLSIGGNAATSTSTTQINAGAFPVSAVVVGSNSSAQPIAATTTGTGSTVMLNASPTYTGTLSGGILSLTGNITTSGAASNGILTRNSTVATVSTCSVSGSLQEGGQYWNGTATAAYIAGLVPTCATGTNGAITESLNWITSGPSALNFAVPNGFVSANTYATTTNCAAVGSSASPSVVACAAAAAGSFSCATTASAATCTINTTAVTANSEIFVSLVADEGTRLGVTCNASPTSVPIITVASKTAGAGFTINLPTFITNPTCWDYSVVN